MCKRFRGASRALLLGCHTGGNNIGTERGRSSALLPPASLNLPQNGEFSDYAQQLRRLSMPPCEGSGTSSRLRPLPPRSTASRETRPSTRLPGGNNDLLWDVVPGSQTAASLTAPAGADCRSSSFTC